MAGNIQISRNPKSKVMGKGRGKSAAPRLSAAQRDPSTPSLGYQSMSLRWHLMNSTLGGTEAMRLAGKIYLPQHAHEPPHAYEERLNAALFTNYTRLTLDYLVGKPFSVPVEFTEDTDQRIKALAADMNLQGDDLTAVCKEWFEKALAKGFAHCMVEHPVAPNGGEYTLADQARLNLRPYWVVLDPEDVIAAEPQRGADGEETYHHVRVKKYDIERVGYEEGIVERIYEYNREYAIEEGKEPTEGVWRVKVDVWRKGKREWEIESTNFSTLDVIPLVTYYTKREGVLNARPELLDLAYTNVTHWQSDSDQRACLTVARFPMLAGSGVDEEKVITVGPHSFLSSTDPQSKYYYVEHTGGALAQGVKDLEMLEVKCAYYGAEMLKERPDRQTATSAIIDTSQTMAPLQRMVVSFISSVGQAMWFTAKWMSLDLKDDKAAVKIYIDFAVSPQKQKQADTLKESRMSGDISHAQYIKGLIELDLLPPGFDETANARERDTEAQKKMDDAIKTAQATKPVAPAGAPKPAAK